MPSTAGHGRADLHLHTNLGDGWTSPAQLVREATRRQLAVIAVTDHDHLEGARRVEELLLRTSSPIELITGVEVSTRSGHLLGLFVSKAPRPMRPVEESIDAIKEQGGLVIVPHPLGRLVPSLSRRRIDRLLNAGYAIDGLETYNPSPANAAQRRSVIAANCDWGLAEIGASDAHFWQHVGAAYTRFRGTGAEDLRRAVVARTTRAGGQEQPPERLGPAVYVAQCAWSWFVDPPRRMARRRRASRDGATSAEPPPGWSPGGTGATRSTASEHPGRTNEPTSADSRDGSCDEAPSTRRPLPRAVGKTP